MGTPVQTGQPPAIKSYFFGKGYSDLGDTIADAWRRNWASASNYGGRGSYWLEQESFQKLLAAFWYGAALAVVVFGTLFTLLISLLHIVILLAFFSVIYLLFSVVAVFERFVMLVRGFFSVCPNCHTRLHLPTYLCDRCGVEHPRLIPSSFGIIHHRCRCGQDLPCTLFANRGRLQSKCPNCVTMLSREHTESRKQFMPIVGGPSVGKSAYLFSLCRHLHDVTATRLGMSAGLIDTHQANTYRQVIDGMDRGRTPDKTVETMPKAFDILFRRSKRSDIALYLYDPAGEAFLDSSSLVPHKFLGYLSGIILLVDPFAFAEIRFRYAAQLRAAEKSIRPSSANIDDIVARLIAAMEKDFGLSPSEKVKSPLAVVINKVDAFDLDELIGERALFSFPALRKESKEERRNRLIKTRLREWGEAGFVHQLETRFAKVRFFTVSALGHSPDARNTRFVAQRVEEPALWVLSQSNRVWKRALSD
jgi:hypothetical protein